MNFVTNLLRVFIAPLNLYTPAIGMPPFAPTITEPIVYVTPNSHASDKVDEEVRQDKLINKIHP